MRAAEAEAVGVPSSYRRSGFCETLESFQNVQTYGEQVGLMQNMG